MSRCCRYEPDVRSTGTPMPYSHRARDLCPQVQPCACGSKRVVLASSVSREWVPCELSSIQGLLRRETLHSHRGLSALFSQHVYIGRVDSRCLPFGTQVWNPGWNPGLESRFGIQVWNPGLEPIRRSPAHLPRAVVAGTSCFSI